MDAATLEGRLEFIRQAERLDVRSGRSSGGRQESTAEQLASVPDGHAVPGWARGAGSAARVAAVRGPRPGRGAGRRCAGDRARRASGQSARERATCCNWPAAWTRRRARLLALWDEYEAAATPEARAVKALDKMETILQHSQGDNPPDFDYGFNLTYGRDYAARRGAARAATLVDEATARRMAIPRADSSSA